jgi:hypothetical protein
MTGRVAYEHAHVQRLVLIVKMATVLEEYTSITQELTVVLFCGQKDSMQRIFIKKYLLLTVGRFCRVKRFHLGGKCFADSEEDETEVAETTVKGLLCCRF